MVNKKSNFIELYADKKNIFKGYISSSIYGDKYNKVSFFYKNLAIEYSQNKNKDIDIHDISIGYEFLYDKFGIFFYTIPNIGVMSYSVDLSKQGYFISNKIGIEKDIFGISVGLFGNFQRDFVNDLELNIFSLGVSLGFSF